MNPKRTLLTLAAATLTALQAQAEPLCYALEDFTLEQYQAKYGEGKSCGTDELNRQIHAFSMPGLYMWKDDYGNLYRGEYTMWGLFL
jgi:hypothetical protein